VERQPDIRLTPRLVAEVAAGRMLSGEAERELPGVSIDTRSLKPGELFFAIRGERFDGVDFAAAALRAGAAGVVVPRGRGGELGASRSDVVVEVDDTVAALQALAHRVRRDSGTTVVAITGSAGKTTTKEVTAEFLATRFQVVRNRGNFNNHIGLPLSLVELTRRPDVAVVELGMNHAGEIRTLVGIAEPNVRVWTNVGDAHLEFFESIEALADAKAEILDGATADSVLVCNADDDRIRSRTSAFAGRVVTFGIERPATVHASGVVDRGIDGMAAQVSTPHGVVDLVTPLVGRANLANVLAAMAVALDLGISRADIAAAARRLKPAVHRGEIVRLSRDITVIDDSYNANPTATRKALELLAAAKAMRRVAVIGEMLELGDRAVELHEQVGRAAFGRADVLVAVGGRPAEALAQAAREAGMPDGAVSHAPTSEAAADALLRVVRDGDVVLVKGSRGVRTDRIVDRLKVELA
jgi:UDP-N-acetylmuramoyl-tripeptide--D-alanyl-D-alanine ligase